MWGMNTFFKPSSFKIKIFLVLVIYVLVGTLFLASYNTTRSKGSRELHTFDKVGMVVAYPAVFLAIPAFYIGENVFSTETNLNSLMTDGGCTNCTSDEFNQPIKTSTTFGLVAGLMVEILFLYVIACAVSFVWDYRKTKQGKF